MDTHFDAEAGRQDLAHEIARERDTRRGPPVGLAWTLVASPAPSQQVVPRW